jgi:putative hydroxymethylpyrimidine transport system substrate-binding protein
VIEQPRRRARTLTSACTLLAAVLSLAACGNKHDTLSAPSAKRFPVMLDSLPDANHEALYAALAGGDFRAVGLNVKLESPAEPSEPLRLLAAGRVDLAIASEPELLLARDRGIKLVSIAALVQRPLASIIALGGRHIDGLAGLAGRRVGTAGEPYQAQELKTVLETAHVKPASVREVDIGSNLLGAMLSGRVDATLGGFWNYQAIQLRLAHRHPLVVPLNEAGVPDYDELVIVAREQQARTDGQDLRAFLQALTRGQRAVEASPTATTATLLAANPSLNRRLQLESIRQTLPAARPSESGKPYGWQSPGQWATFGYWMLNHKLLEHNPNGALPPFTNEFLPGQGI